jgi:uncharacterized protein (TIGR03083 family)
MPGTDVWPLVHAERAALADDLGALSDPQWATPSLCDDWTVHEVLGHLVATAKKTPFGFLTDLTRSGFRFQRMSERDVARESGRPPAETLAEFHQLVTATTAPPGPTDSWLGETVIHGEDIRRPLGIHHAHPMAALTRVADFYKRSNLLLGTKQRIAGVQLQATDTEWSNGSGPEVRGPMLSLLMAMTGRQAALVDLTGDGLGLLRG